MNQQKITQINKKINNIIDLWLKLSFSKLRNIHNKANIVIFSVLTSNENSPIFLKEINSLLKEKHPYGELVFIGYDKNELIENIGDGVNSNNTNYRLYKMTIFTDLNLDDDEYIDRLQIFYDKLEKIIKTRG